MPRPRGRFGELSYIILLILQNSLMPSNYIASLLNEPTTKISTYLSRLKRKGLVQYIDGFWSLTPKGKEYAKKLDNIYKFYGEFLYNNYLNNCLKNKISESKKTTKIDFYLSLYYKNIQKSTETMINQSKNQLKTTKTLDQILSKAEEFLGRELDYVEKAILKFLFSFSSNRKRRYWWPDDGLSLSESLASKLSRKGISISSIDIARALRELEAAGIIFIIYDKRRRVPKIRIDRVLLEAVE